VSLPLDDGHVPDPEQPDDLASRIVAATVAVLVVLMIVAVFTVVVFAGGSRSASASRAVVFTIQAPYNPIFAADTTPTITPTVTGGKYVPAAQGAWTPKRGIRIALRAMHWQGWPYSFDGGNQDGPTYGVAVDHDSRNDPSIKGFDCSGLVMYAMAPYRNLSHSAAAQYEEAGTVHPSLNQLWPGDLIFWSKDGTVEGVGHVAIYIGNGYVIQAPESGSYIQVTRLDQVEPGKIGTTRPLT
jgi:cell wall-associated NlpC family hydrolase